MIVQCPACSSRYRINEDKIPGRGARVTCPSCGHKFVVEKASEAPSRGVRVALQRGEEDDEADVPTTVMPNGAALLKAARRTPEPSHAPAASPAVSAPPSPAAAWDPAGSSAPSAAEPRPSRPAAVVRPAAPAPAPAVKAGPPVVVIAVAVVGLVLFGIVLAATIFGG